MTDQISYPNLDISTLKPPMNIVYIRDVPGLSRLKDWVEKEGQEQIPIAGLDTETNFVHDFFPRRIRTIQIGNKDIQFVIDLLHIAGSEQKLIESQGYYGAHNGDTYKELFDILGPVLSSNKFLKVGQNLAFEYEVFLWNFGIRIWNMYSTDLAERVIQAGEISLKKYAEFSLESLIHRYFKKHIDKSSQKTFDLSSELTDKQIEYAALDIRLPLAIRLMQMRELLVDKLLTTTIIECDAIGSYVDMHLTGWRLDTERWLKRLEAVKLRRIEEVRILDEGFIPIVGLKDQQIDFEELARREFVWKNNFEEATPEEKELATQKRLEKDKEKKLVLGTQLKVLENRRKALKAEARRSYSELSKKRTEVINNLPDCEGQAYINYGSGPQLIAALKQFKGMALLDSSSDDALLAYNDRPLIQTLRKYKKGKKETGTYGTQWVNKWKNKPCKEEGFLHPWDGRLHCLFNQLEAETGRSSSSKPNAQNLPHDPEVRACFICDPPNENIRISVCCDSDTYVSNDGEIHYCSKCNMPCDTKAEEYVIVTVDMAGAELRIIAEAANAKSWIMAFEKGWDVHSVSTEILEPTKWPSLACKGGEKWFDPEKNKEITLPPCDYYKLGEDGKPQRQKCKCPGHIELRAGTKAVNFLLCYGGGPDALADELGITTEEAKILMRKHELAFPDVWKYLERSGKEAKAKKEARDMFGRRRLLPYPTRAIALDWFLEEKEERLELTDEECKTNLFNFKAANLREPTKEEKWSLTHRKVTEKDVDYAVRALLGSMERKGKNHCIQGTNATIIKRAMGCGFDKDGKPYLWHTLSQFKAKLLSMVHDELIVQCPKRYGEQVKALIGDAFKRAAAEVMKKVIMEFDGHIAVHWQK